MPKVTQALNSFLTARKAVHNGPDLLERVLQHPGMEVQVNVAAGKGWAVDGKPSTFTDSIDEWWNIRIPKNAKSEPVFKDYELPWPLDLHAEAIGCTGWDWQEKVSRWVGFDFDSITGHAVGVGVSDEELEKVKETAKALPYVEVRRSTGGNGLHLYVMVDCIPTENHTVHAALGRAILGMMSCETGFDFAERGDGCGGNMWVWARKMNKENQGLTLVKAATATLGKADVPSNWRDHIAVVQGQRSKIRIDGVPEEHMDPFEKLASSRTIVELDSTHKAIIDELRHMGGTVQWAQDHYLLQTHTAMLQRLLEAKAKELKLVGFFKTNSKGGDLGQPNCFLFPLQNGGWKVYRFSPGIAEAETWEQDGEGWTTCYFNRTPNLKVAARAMGGVEDAEKGGFVFESVPQAIEAAKALGRTLPIPEAMTNRETRLKSHKDGRLVVQVAKEEGDEGMKSRGWQAKKGYWLQVFETRTDNKSTDTLIAQHDNIIRALSTPNGDRAGWMAHQKSDEWHRVPKDDARSLLLAHDFPKAEADIMIGRAVQEAWKLVNLPFQTEYPGDRQWNLGAAQLRYQPANLADDEVPFHPHWNLVLKHCGQDLDDALQNLDWARAANIKTGGQYLLTWTACMLREPFLKLPYLFLYGEQNSGKSILHEALALLMTKGVTSADRALTNNNDFNGELANAVLAVIEEKNISISPGAYNKIKEWVTAEMLWIRKMRTDSYPQVNTLHFIHLANDRNNIAIGKGDTRITVLFVPALDPGREIPKSLLLDKLKAEAPHFMRTIMDLRLPQVIGRLALPVVNTDNKARAEDAAATPLQAFLSEACHLIPGASIKFTDFYERFQLWMKEEEHPDASKWASHKAVKDNLPHQIPYGVKHSNQRFVGNISWDASTPPSTVLVVKNGKLKPKGDK